MQVARVLHACFIIFANALFLHLDALKVLRCLTRACFRSFKALVTLSGLFASSSLISLSKSLINLQGRGHGGKHKSNRSTLPELKRQTAITAKIETMLIRAP
jgi:hypothetical protein